MLDCTQMLGTQHMRVCPASHRSQHGSGVPSPQSEAEVLGARRKASVDSEDSDTSIPGLQQSYSPRAADSPRPGSPDEGKHNYA